MIRIDISCDQSGFILCLHSSGHAGDTKGELGLACGIVSFALRAFGRTAGGQAGIQLSGSVSQPGSFDMMTSDVSADVRDWYRGASEVLIQGLRDVKTDFPTLVDLTIHTI